MSASHSDLARLKVVFMDGRSGQAQQVSIWIEQGMLQMAGQGLLRQIPLRQVHWCNLDKHGECIAHLPDGGALHADDKRAWQQWQQQENLPIMAVPDPAQGWRWGVIAAMLLLAICATSYVFALPRQTG